MHVKVQKPIMSVSWLLNGVPAMTNGAAFTEDSTIHQRRSKPAAITLSIQPSRIISAQIHLELFSARILLINVARLNSIHLAVGIEAAAHRLTRIHILPHLLHPLMAVKVLQLP